MPENIEKSQMRGPARIVVLIPAHDEAASIQRTISALHGQTVPADQMIVTADNCIDQYRTAEESFRRAENVLAGFARERADEVSDAKLARFLQSFVPISDDVGSS